MDNERAAAIFTEMNGLVIELARDPSSLGPRYFQDIIATCRNYLNIVSLRSSEISQERFTLTGDLHSAEAAYDLDLDRVMTTEDQVRNLGNTDDRNRAANYMLRKEKARILGLKDQLRALDQIAKVITHRLRELHSTMNAIKDQRRLMQTDLMTGAMYGDERTDQGSTRPGSSPTDLDGMDLASILDEAADPGQPEATDKGDTEVPPAPTAGMPIEEVIVPDAPAVPSSSPETPTPQPIVVSAPEPEVVVPSEPSQAPSEDVEMAAIHAFLDEGPGSSTPAPTPCEEKEDVDLKALLDSI